MLLNALMSVGVASCAVAQIDVAACSPALAKDYESYVQSSTEKKHLLNIVDERTWQELKQNGGADVSFLGVAQWQRKTIWRTSVCPSDY
jgi:hypothetical protein